MRINYEEPTKQPIESIEIEQPNIRMNYEAAKTVNVRPRTFGPSGENVGLILEGAALDKFLDAEFTIALDIERSTELRDALTLLIDQLSD